MKDMNINLMCNSWDQKISIMQDINARNWQTFGCICFGQLVIDLHLTRASKFYFEYYKENVQYIDFLILSTGHCAIKLDLNTLYKNVTGMYHQTLNLKNLKSALHPC